MQEKNSAIIESDNCCAPKSDLFRSNTGLKHGRLTFKNVASGTERLIVDCLSRMPTAKVKYIERFMRSEMDWT